jgi:hypothetical protein
VGWVFGIVFAAIAILFWDDVDLRRTNIVLANIWWAAYYIRSRK